MSSTFQQAKVFYDLQRFEEAIRILNEAHLEDPGDIEIFNLTAWCFYFLDRAQTGFNVACNALALDPENVESLIIHSACAARQGMYRKAEDSLNLAASIAPQNAYIHYHRAFQNVQKRNYEQALDSINVAISIEPNSPVYFALQSQIQHFLGNHTDANLSVSKALRLNPEIVQGHMQRGRIFRREGNVKASVEALLEALRNDPKNNEARWELIETLRCKFPPYLWVQKVNHWIAPHSYAVRALFWLSPIFIVALGLLFYSIFFIYGQVGIARTCLVLTLPYGALFLAHMIVKDYSLAFIDGAIAFNKSTSFVIVKELRFFTKMSVVLLTLGVSLVGFGLIIHIVEVTATGVAILLLCCGLAYFYDFVRRLV